MGIRPETTSMSSANSIQRDPTFMNPPHRGMLLLSSTAINILALALPLMTMQIYDRVMANHAEDTLMVLSIGVIVAAMLEFTLRTMRSFIVSADGATFEQHAMDQAVSRLVESEPRSLASRTSASLMQDIASAGRLKDYYSGQMATTLMVDAPFALLFLGLAAYLAGSLALVAIGVLLIIGTYAWKQGLELEQLMHDRERQDNRRYGFITETLHAIHTVKAQCLEAVSVRKFENVQRNSGILTFNITRAQGETGTYSYLATQLMTVAIVCLGAPMAITGKITVGVLVACIMLSGQVMQPMQRALGIWLRLQDINVARNRLASLTGRKEREYLADDQLNPNLGTLKMENVRFSYLPGQPILDGLSLEIGPGDAIAIQGAPGIGKTTLLEIMAGLSAPDSGRIQLCGMDPARLPQAVRNQYVAYLSTRGVTFVGNIMDNLTGFDTRLQNEAIEMADLLGLSQAIALLPAGYDTPLDGLATDVVPPGFKQRVAIARVLLRRPRLILYDNADQGLDRESYGAVFTLLTRLKRKASLVIVSDDRNMMSLADRVLDLRHGVLLPLSDSQLALPSRFRQQEVSA